MASGRKKTLYWDKVQKVWVQYTIKKNGQRKKHVLAKAKGKTTDPAAKRQALEEWERIKGISGNKTAYQIRKERQELARGIVRGPGHGYYPSHTIVGLVERYLARIEQKVTVGDLTGGRLRGYKYAFKQFQEYCGEVKWSAPNTDTTGGAKHLLNHQLLIGFWTQMDRRRSGQHKRLSKLSISTVRINFWVIKDFFRWCYENGHILYKPVTTDMKWKKSLKERLFKSKDVVTFTRDELKTLLNYKNERYSEYPMELWIMMGINFGLTSVDISGITLQHIHWGTRTVINAEGQKTKEQFPERLIKIRQKTAIEANWLMMETTSQLLMWYLQDLDYQNYPKDVPIFLTRTGKPVNEWVVKKDGPITRKDYVYVGFRRRLEKTGLLEPGYPKSFKTLRKTGATTIALLTEGRYPLLEQKYLAHRPHSVARLHYAAVDDTLLDTWLREMEKHYDFKTILSGVERCRQLETHPRRVKHLRRKLKHYNTK